VAHDVRDVVTRTKLEAMSRKWHPGDHSSQDSDPVLHSMFLQQKAALLHCRDLILARSVMPRELFEFSFVKLTRSSVDGQTTTELSDVHIERTSIPIFKTEEQCLVNAIQNIPFANSGSEDVSPKSTLTQRSYYTLCLRPALNKE